MFVHKVLSIRIVQKSDLEFQKEFQPPQGFVSGEVFGCVGKHREA